MGALVRAERRTSQALQEQAVARGRQYLTFIVAGESFAIAIASIKEIIEYRKPTDVPMMPPYMRGVINLRGRVVPVIDLSVRFGRAPIEAARRTCIVILEIQQEGEQHGIGVVVDAVSAVLEIADADVEPPPSFGANLRTDFITGMGKIGEKFVIILDIERVLSIEELAALAAIADEEPQARGGAAAAASGEQD
jgi:purine-binding chemotaxis protein CheW